jgi:hypothetical protein
VLAVLVARAADPDDDVPVALEAKRARDAVEIRISSRSKEHAGAGSGSKEPAKTGSRSKEPVTATSAGAWHVEALEAFFVRSVLELHGGELRAAGADAPPSFVVTLPLAETFASP